MSTPPLLALDDVACQQGGCWLFAHVSLHVPPGGAVWLRGANGRGKTSLLRIAAGLADPAAGAVARTGPVRMVGHAPALHAELGAAEGLAFLSTLHGGRPARRDIEDGLVALGLPRRLHDVPARRLSQGQRRRAALAGLLLPPPAPLWLLDEPFDALDDEAAARVEGLLAAHVDGGGGLLFTSHRPPGGPLRARTTTWDLDEFAGAPRPDVACAAEAASATTPARAATSSAAEPRAPVP